MATWAQTVWAQTVLGGRGAASAIEGKALRGIHGEELPGVRLVAAYEVQTGLVLAQGGVRREMPPDRPQLEEEEEEEEELAEEKARAELSVAPQVLRMVALRGGLVTGDALYCQRTLGQQIRRAKGPSLLVIKTNQAQLLEEVALLFDQPPPGDCFATASSRRAKRNRLEVRTLTVSSALASYLGELGWMGAQQVMRLQSQVHVSAGAHRGTTRQVVRYFLTSLGGQVNAADLLRLTSCA